MVVGVVKIKIYVPWVHSLKEKRMEVKSICGKVRNRYNVSIAEIEDQDIHQMIVIGFTCITGNNALADSILDNVINYIECNTEGEVTSVERELI